MLTLFVILGGGVLFGLLPRIFCRKTPVSFHTIAGKVLSFSIYLMLAIMGYQLGANSGLLASLASVGGLALFICLCGVAGSIVAARALWRSGVLPPCPRNEVDGAQTNSLGNSLAGSLLTLLSLLAGFIAGYNTLLPFFFSCGLDLPMLSLYFLLFMAGVNMGSNPQLRNLLGGLHPSILLLPLCSIAGSLVFCALGGFLYGLLPSAGDWKPADFLAVGSGMGYYSLSSVLIASLKEAAYGPALSASLAAIALLSNVLREVVALVAAPLFYRIGGPYAPVAAAGATAADVCCPVLMRTSGDKILPAVLAGGFITDFSVPFLVTFFCSL